MAIVQDNTDKFFIRKAVEADLPLLEGGYNLTLANGVHAVLEVLAGGDIPELAPNGVREVTEAAAFHRSAFTDNE
ncbi:MAG: hypothetical protein WEB02_12405 [Methylophaga sp.]